MVRAKAEAALARGPDRDRLRRRDRGRARAPATMSRVVAAQLDGSLPDDWERGELVVAYEPVWAIGTGKVADAADVAEMHAAIRAALPPASASAAGASASSTAARSRPTTPPSCSPSPTSTAPWSAAPASPPTQFVPIVEAAAAAS